MDLGFEQEGFETKWQVEKDPFCLELLRKRFPYATQFDNAFDFDRSKAEPVRLIHGGFPCQPFATVGDRKGEEDDRFLWPEMYRIICDFKPEFVVAENVFGLLTGDMEAIFEKVCLDLEALSYTVQTIVLPVISLDGPNIRDRVFIIARDRQKGPRTSGYLADAPVESEKRTGRDAEASRSRTGRVVYPTRFRPVVRTGSPGSNGSCWPPRPDVGRMAYGIPRRLDRLGAIGNAVSPPVARKIAQAIKHALNTP